MTFDEISKQQPSAPVTSSPQKTTGLSFADIAGQQNTPISPTPKATGDIFSRLASMTKSALSYAPAFFTIGPMGVAAQYTARHPKETMEAAGSFVKSAVSAPYQLATGGAAEIAGMAGRPDIQKSLRQPVNVPILGQIRALPTGIPALDKPVSAQTLGETALQAIDVGLTGSGIGQEMNILGKTVRTPTKYVVDKALEAIGPFSKWANKFSTIDKGVIEAAQNPQTAQELSQLRAGTLPKAEIPTIPKIPKPIEPIMSVASEAGPVPGSPEELRAAGQGAYDTAMAQKDAASKAYGEGRRAIIDANEGKLIQRSKDFVTGAQEAIQKEGITIAKDGSIDVTGSQFEGDANAQTILQRVKDIMTRPVVQQEGRSVADDLLTRREALTGVMSKVSKDDPALGRVVRNMRDSFDTILDNALTKASASETPSSLRAAYSESMSATKSVIESMTKVENGRNVFSEDKAYAFISNALKDTKFDNTRMLQNLDAVAGTAHAKDVAKISEGRAAYERAIADSERQIAEINAKAKQTYQAAVDARTKILIEAKRAQDVAKAEAAAKLDALKQLNKKLSQSTPAVLDSYFSVAKRYLGDIPLVGKKLASFFAPNRWGDIALAKGLKAVNPKAASDVSMAAKTWILSHLIASGYQLSQQEDTSK